MSQANPAGPTRNSFPPRQFLTLGEIGNGLCGTFACPARTKQAEHGRDDSDSEMKFVEPGDVKQLMHRSFDGVGIPTGCFNCRLQASPRFGAQG